MHKTSRIEALENRVLSLEHKEHLYAALQKKDEIRLLQRSISELKEQIGCGSSGHQLTIAKSYFWQGTKLRMIGFECIGCGFHYGKDIEDLTKKEKALLDAFDMKE